MLRKKIKNVLTSIKNFARTIISFAVYTFIDSAIGQSAEVQAFQQKLDLFSEDFAGITTNFDTVVDMKHVEETYEDVFTAYNEMVHALGFADKAVNAKRF